MATKFIDNNGREWSLHLTLGAVKEINRELGVNLLDPWDGTAIDAFVADPLRLAATLAKAIPLANEVEAEALASGLRGVGLDNAIAAFYEDLASFFPAGHRQAFMAFMTAMLDALVAALSDAAKTYAPPGKLSSKTSKGTKPERNPQKTGRNRRATNGSVSTKCGAPAPSPRGRTPGRSTTGSTSGGKGTAGK